MAPKQTTPEARSMTRLQLSPMLLLAGLALGGCAERSPTGPGQQLEPVREFTSQERQLAASATRFGLSLLAEINAAEAQPNLLISPLSASMALGMTMNGAAGETYDAMRRTLGFDGLSEAEINAAYRGLIAQLRARDPKVEFVLANSAWHAQGFPVKAPFLDAARQYFDAEVQALDFAHPQSPKTISAWAEQKTGGRIKELVRQISPLEVLFLVNAVYFKAPWSSPFEPAGTRDRAFTRLDGGTVQVPTMTADGAFPHVRTESYQAVEMLYADSAFSMVLVAPTAGHSLDPLLPLLEPARWHALVGSLQSNRILLSVPKFRFDYEKELGEPLRTLGMGIAFQPFLADFTRIADRDDLHITRVKQKSFIDVHERGTEAAAATVVGVGVVSMPPELRFDRPFLFAIRERSTGTLLFMGRVGDPRAS
jgi:serine protease inhibitor